MAFPVPAVVVGATTVEVEAAEEVPVVVGRAVESGIVEDPLTTPGTVVVRVPDAALDAALERALEIEEAKLLALEAAEEAPPPTSPFRQASLFAKNSIDVGE